VVGDKQRYQQILLNIIQNGIKFTYKGGIDLYLDFKENYDVSNLISTYCLRKMTVQNADSWSPRSTTRESAWMRAYSRGSSGSLVQLTNLRRPASLQPRGSGSDSLFADNFVKS